VERVRTLDAIDIATWRGYEWDVAPSAANGTPAAETVSAARWLVGPDADVDVAVRARLAGLALAAPGLSDGARQRLRHAARREAADRALAEREAGEVLRALAAAGVEVLVWKGLAVAERWAEPRLRPAGDLDLLVGAAELDAAVVALAPFATPSPAAAPRWIDRVRPSSPGVELWPRPGRTLAIDVQTRPFRTVGATIDGAALLARSQAGSIADARCRILDPADEILVVLVHAAKHGARAPRWVVDGLALTGRSDDAWRTAWERAVAAEVTRPLCAMAALLRSLGATPPSWLPPPPPGWSLLCDGEAARQGRPWSRAERYLAELLFEPNLRHLAARGLGVLARLLFSFAPHTR